jgi:peptide/nickel transport system ATP-binding protein
VMLNGRIVEEGTRDQIINDPQHDYTRALLSAVPKPDAHRRRRPLTHEGCGCER